MTKHDAIKHLSYKIAYYKGIEQKKWADSVSIDALEIAVRAMAEDAKEISYADCSDALLKMWMDNVITDGEYNRIMEKLNEREKQNEQTN